MQQPRQDGGIPSADMYSNRLANMENVMRWRLEQRAQAAVKALSRNGFEAVYAASLSDARQEVLQRIPEAATIGAGGSMTIRQLEILKPLEDAGHTLYDHWRRGLSQEEILAVRRAQLTCDVFLSSVNAVSLQGQLVNTDGIGNRLSAMTFGPGKVILVAGANKVEDDLDSALKRIRSVCAPLALRETGANLPCVQRGICGNCQSDARLCRATLILECRPLLTEMIVIMVGEALGF